MPYTAKQGRFFRMCEHHPEKARGKCPSRQVSRKLAHEAARTAVRKAKK